ncbi:uncharacterized protein J3R85_020829 [Psidium guajava]|nr:uncharacterized protein J3R85_020829 [Psidium guajava]
MSSPDTRSTSRPATRESGVGSVEVGGGEELKEHMVPYGSGGCRRGRWGEAAREVGVDEVGVGGSEDSHSGALGQIRLDGCGEEGGDGGEDEGGRGGYGVRASRRDWLVQRLSCE